MQSGLSVDPNNAGQIKEKSDTEACMRRAESAKELLSQVGALAAVVMVGYAQKSFLPFRIQLQPRFGGKPLKNSKL